MNTYNMYFSAKGTTEKIACAIAKGLGNDTKNITMLKFPISSDISIAKNDCLVVSMPVYAGRLPPICLPQLECLKGEGTPAIAVVTYGNRAYDDALLELTDLLSAKGFVVIAAAAFIAEHSIFPEAAQGRPNSDDMNIIADFTAKCSEILKETSDSGSLTIKVDGSRPYCKASTVPLHPVAGKACTSCGICVTVCPTDAISLENSSKTNNDVCISCGACIKACPENARNYEGLIYKMAKKSFVNKNSQPKQPKIFFAEKI